MHYFYEGVAVQNMHVQLTSMWHQYTDVTTLISTVERCFYVQSCMMVKKDIEIKDIVFYLNVFFHSYLLLYCWYLGCEINVCCELHALIVLRNIVSG